MTIANELKKQIEERATLHILTTLKVKDMQFSQTWREGDLFNFKRYKTQVEDKSVTIQQIADGEATITHDVVSILLPEDLAENPVAREHALRYATEIIIDRVMNELNIEGRRDIPPERSMSVSTCVTESLMDYCQTLSNSLQKGFVFVNPKYAQNVEDLVPVKSHVNEWTTEHSYYKCSRNNFRLDATYLHPECFGILLEFGDVDVSGDVIKINYSFAAKQIWFNNKMLSCQIDIFSPM